MSEQMEKLVEEIAQEAIRFYHLYPSSIPLESDRDFVRGLITLIGKAYADGLELPGEVGRYPGHGFKPDWALDMYAIYDATDYIALRKEEKNDSL